MALALGAREQTGSLPWLTTSRDVNTNRIPVGNRNTVVPRDWQNFIEFTV